MSIKLLVVDAHPIVIRGLEAVFQGPELQVIAAASDADTALKLFKKQSPDCVLLDARLGKEDGLQLLSRFKVESPNTPILIFTEHSNPTYIARSVALGASGYLHKTQSEADLMRAVQMAVRGENIWQRSQLRQVSGPMLVPRQTGTRDYFLTPRESEVLKHLTQGMSNKDIAAALGISFETVKEHLGNVFRKLGVADRTQAAVLAVKHELV